MSSTIEMVRDWRSTVSKYGYHEYPKDWAELERSLTGQAADIRPLQDCCRVRVTVSCRGGGNVGYRLTGNVAVKAEWYTATKKHNQTKGATYRGPWSIEKIRAWADRVVSPKVKHQQARLRVLTLVRESGLFGKPYMRRLSDKIKAAHGDCDLNRIEVLRDVQARTAKYVIRWGQCPGCGNRNTFSEQIEGFKCLNCNKTWVDIIGRESHWEG